MLRNTLFGTAAKTFQLIFRNYKAHSFTQAKQASLNMALQPTDFQLYFKPRLSTIEPQCQGIIESLAKTDTVDLSIKSKMDKYLDSYKEGRTLQGLVLLLTALHMYKDESVRLYRQHILEFIIRQQDVSLIRCDSRSLKVLIAELNNRVNEVQIKIKINSIKYMTIRLLLSSHHVINPSHFMVIINLLKSFNDGNIVTEAFHFLKFSSLFQQKLHIFFNNYLEERTTLQQNKIITSFLMVNLLNIYKIYPSDKEEYSKTLFDVLMKVVLPAEKMVKYYYIVSCYKDFPVIGKDAKGVYYKDLLFEEIVKINKLKMVKFKQSWHDNLLCYGALSFEFYKFMNTIQFRYQDDLNFLLKEDIAVPNLPDFFWQTYKYKPAEFHRNQISSNIIEKIYRERWIKTEQASVKTTPPSILSDNEIVWKLNLALKKLGLTFQRQIEVCGRFADFLIDGNIVVQCDGDHHFNPHMMQLNESTQFRNLHLLLSGYKMILINIFEYNVHRDVDSLALLIRKKLGCLQRNGAIIVI